MTKINALSSKLACIHIPGRKSEYALLRNNAWINNNNKIEDMIYIIED
jgi:hypothetical protein